MTPFPFNASAAAPTLDHLYPVAVQAGTTNALTAIGKFDPWPPKVWIDTPGVMFKPETNNGKFVVELAADARPGPHLIRLFNEQGASALRFLIVTRDPQLAEQEPNDEFKKPQSIERLPAVINGRLEKGGDVDSYAVTLDAGQTLVARLEAYTLASPVDAVLRLVDFRGVPLAMNHDDGRTLDPLLTWPATTHGTSVVQVFGFAYPADSDVRFTGNNKCVYRLHLSSGPMVHHTLPLGVQRGARTTLQAAGWNLGRDRECSFEGAGLAHGATEAWLSLRRSDFQPDSTGMPVLLQSTAGCAEALPVPVGDGPEWLERDLAHVTDGTNALTPPFAVTGCINSPDDEDRFRFRAGKGDKLLFEIQAAAFGFPLDAWLKVEDGRGKELARNDDSQGNSDPRLEWTSGDDGEFLAAVGSVLRRGSAEHLYRLAVHRATPALKLTVSDTAFTIEPGRTNSIKVMARRLHGFAARLTLTASGLPEGLNAAGVDIPEKGGDVTLPLVAAADARPFNGPVQIVATETESGHIHHATADLTSSSVNNGVPGGFTRLIIESVDQFWLTVLAPPPLKTENAEKKKQ